MKKIKIKMSLLIIGFLVSSIGIGQTINERRLEFCGVDMITAGLIGGIGSMVHKSSNQTKWQAFTKGFTKGSIGGFISFIGKDNSIQVRNGHWGYAWLNKGLNSVGSSIIENTASGNKALSNFGVDYGFIRMDISKSKTSVRLQPFSLAGFATCMFLSNGHFSGKESLMYGVPTFVSNSYVAGVAIMNNVMIDKDTYHNATAGHELIHTYQYRESFAITNIYMKNKSKYIYWDMPNVMGSYLANSYAAYIKNDYYFNYYEYQAEGLSNKLIKP